MKVSGHNLVNPEVKTGQAQEKDGLRQTKTQAKDLETSQSVKTSAHALNKIKNRIGLEPEVRPEKVAELKEKIRSGEYKVDAQKIAGKMIVESLRDQI